MKKLCCMIHQMDPGVRWVRMICSIDEFANYMAFHLSAWPPNNAKDDGPVKRSSVREMHHPWRLNGFNPNYKYPDGRSLRSSFRLLLWIGLDA